MKQVVSRGHSRPLAEISFIEDGPDNTLLVSAAHDKIPQIRNGETGDWIGSFHGHKGAVWSAKIDLLTRTLAVTASGDFSAKLWCVATGKELFEFKHKHVVKTVDFAMDTLKIASGCQDGLMRIFDTCRPEQAAVEYKVSSSGLAESISKLSWSTEHKDLLIIAKKNGLLEKIDTRIDSNKAVVASAVVPSGGENVIDLELNSNHGIIMVASGKKVCSYGINGLELIKEFDMPNPMTFKEEGGVSLSPDGKKFIAGGSDLWLREFDYHSGEVLRTLKGHHGPIRCVRYHPSGNMGASGSEDATIRLWDLSYVSS